MNNVTWQLRITMNPSTSFYFICAISWQRDMLPNHYLHQENQWLEYGFNLPKGSIDGSGSLAPIDIRRLGRFDVLSNASHVEHVCQCGYNNVIFTTHVPGNGEHTNYLWWWLGDGANGIVISTLWGFLPQIAHSRRAIAARIFQAGWEHQAMVGRVVLSYGKHLSMEMETIPPGWFLSLTC